MDLATLPEVMHSDCIQYMRKLPKQTFQLAIADPPHNIGVSYEGYNDLLPKSEYLVWSEKWISQLRRILKNSGVFYLAINDENVAELKIITERLGFKLRRWIIWHYTFGQNQRTNFIRSHTHILYFTLSKNSIFNANQIREPSLRQRVYNDKRAHPGGKVPDDVWEFPRVCGTFKERVRSHPCQMPISLLERVILASSNERDMILDPFAGSGATLVAAQRLNRQYLGIEQSRSYCDQIKERLEQEKLRAYEIKKR